MTGVVVLPDSRDNAELELPTTLTVGSLDAAWLEQAPSPDVQLTVDLSSCQFIEPVALQLLIALLARRARLWPRSTTDGPPPFVLKLPKAKPVRDVFRIWDFPRALCRAVDLDVEKFRTLVSEESLRYFGETDVTGIHLRNIVSIQSFAQAEAKDDSTAPPPTDIGTSVFLNHVFQRQLGERGTFIANRVISEAFRNATRHPGAALVQAASQISSPKREAESKRSSRPSRPHGTYSFVVWDNGRSVAETLRPSVDQGVKFDQSAFESLHRTFNVRVHVDEGAETKSFQTSSRKVPTRGVTDAELLLAAVYPGVATGGNSPGQQRGIGLFYLTNYVVDVLGGEVSIRSGLDFLHLKAATAYVAQQTHLSPLSAKIRSYTRKESFIQGNLITVRFPMTAIQSSEHTSA